MIYILCIVVFYFLFVIYFNLKYPELRWNWSDLDESKLNFPKSFFWGTATASHQVEGDCTNNNWYNWENSLDSKGKPTIKDNQKAGLACDHWNRYKEDTELLKKLGVSHYRLSLEWSKIEPEKGKFNQNAITHYKNVIDHLIDNNITPYITLHHFTNPIWFDKLGGFEKQKNIEYFIIYCKEVFSLYSDVVKYWCTINEPEVYSVMGYFSGVFPPGNKDAQLTATVHKNLLISHTKVYYELKKMSNGDTCKIGIVKNVMQFDPARRWHLLDWLACRITDIVYNKMSLSYLKFGKIKINIPFFINLAYTDTKAGKATDFFGLNYYSHVHLKFQFNTHEFFTNVYPDKDIMTDMPYTIYPEGLYRAIHQVKSIGKPIIITENGIADAKDDRRALFIRRYIFAMNRALNEGIDIKGYFYWSLMDNFEWAEGYDMKFGLYEVDFDTQNRKLREGSKEFIKIINESK